MVLNEICRINGVQERSDTMYTVTEVAKMFSVFFCKSVLTVLTECVIIELPK